MKTNLTDSQLAALDVRCDCRGYKGEGHGPLCPITRANLETSAAERAAVALARLVKSTTDADRAKRFGSGSPLKRAIHRAGEVQVSGSMAEIAHGRVLKARQELTDARTYLSRLEHQWDRDMSHDTLAMVHAQREQVTAREAAVMRAVETANLVATTEAEL